MSNLRLVMDKKKDRLIDSKTICSIYKYVAIYSGLLTITFASHLVAEILAPLVSALPPHSRSLVAHTHLFFFWVCLAVWGIFSLYAVFYEPDCFSSDESSDSN